LISYGPDVFQKHCLRSILRVSFRYWCSNAEVRLRIGCNPPSEDVRARRLRLFGHLARAKPSADYARAVVLCTHSRMGHRRTGSVHLADQGSMAAYSRIRPPACKYWSVHCLATSSSFTCPGHARDDETVCVDVADICDSVER